MAKRKYTRAKAVASRAYSFVRRKARRSYAASRGASMSLIDVGFSFGYGYARPFLSGNSIVQKGIAMMPVGGAAKDNLFLGLAAYLITWLVKPKNHFVKLGLRTVVQSEAFLAGAKMNMLGFSALTNDSQAPALTTGGGDFL